MHFDSLSHETCGCAADCILMPCLVRTKMAGNGMAIQCKLCSIFTSQWFSFWNRVWRVASENYVVGLSYYLLSVTLLILFGPKF